MVYSGAEGHNDLLPDGRSLVKGDDRKRRGYQRAVPRASRDMRPGLRDLSLPVRVLVYVTVAALVFAISAGAGVVGALMWRGDLGPSEPRALQPSEERTATQTVQEEAASRRDETEYAGRVGDIQAESVEAFVDSHEKLLRYDALTAEDVEKMRKNRVVLRESIDRVDRLHPPPDFEEHREVFRSAVDELHEASRLAYKLAANPTAATQAAFDEYDRRVNSAASRLRRSNEILGRDHKVIEDVRETGRL